MEFSLVFEEGDTTDLTALTDTLDDPSTIFSDKLQEYEFDSTIYDAEMVSTVLAMRPAALRFRAAVASTRSVCRAVRRETHRGPSSAAASHGGCNTTTAASVAAVAAAAGAAAIRHECAQATRRSRRLRTTPPRHSLTIPDCEEEEKQSYLPILPTRRRRYAAKRMKTNQMS